MKEVQEFSMGRMCVDGSFGFLTLVKNELGNLPKEGGEPAAAGASPALTSKVAAFEAALKAFDAELQAPGKMDSVSAAADADTDRDLSWRGGNLHVRAMCYHPDLKIRAIAEKVKEIYGKYGNPTNRSQEEETSDLHNLLQDLKALDSDEIEKMDMSVWIEDLEAKEAAFEAAVSVRSKEESARVTGVVKKVRNEAESAYRELVVVVNALVAINGDEPYADFIDGVNALIARQKKLMKQRDGKPSTGKSPSNPGNEDDRPVIPNEPEESDGEDTKPTDPEEGEGEGGEDDRPVIPDEGDEKPEPGKDENGDDLPPIE